VLVANHESIKLADFGLSREIDDDIYLGILNFLNTEKFRKRLYHIKKENYNE
jgi:hypothetical protein